MNRSNLIVPNYNKSISYMNNQKIYYVYCFSIKNNKELCFVDILTEYEYSDTIKTFKKKEDVILLTKVEFTLSSLQIKFFLSILFWSLKRFAIELTPQEKESIRFNIKGVFKFLDTRFNVFELITEINCLMKIFKHNNDNSNNNLSLQIIKQTIKTELQNCFDSDFYTEVAESLSDKLNIHKPSCEEVTIQESSYSCPPNLLYKTTTSELNYDDYSSSIINNLNGSFSSLKNLTYNGHEVETDSYHSSFKNKSNDNKYLCKTPKEGLHSKIKLKEQYVKDNKKDNYNSLTQLIPKKKIIPYSVERDVNEDTYLHDQDGHQTIDYKPLQEAFSVFIKNNVFLTPGIKNHVTSKNLKQDFLSSSEYKNLIETNSYIIDQTYLKDLSLSLNPTINAWIKENNLKTKFFKTELYTTKYIYNVSLKPTII